MTLRKLFLLLAMVMLLAACGSGGADSAGVSESAAQGESVAEGEGEAAAGRGFGAVAGGAVTTTQAQGGDDGAVDEDAPSAAEPDIEELPEPPAVRTGDRVIKEGTISVEVEKDQFDQAFFAVVATARRFGGDAVGSSTRTTENGDIFGSVTVRVPVENFEDLLLGVGKIGAVRTRDVDSQDVGAEYTDLESRLRHLEAQERFYLGLFDRADSVQDAITVQQQLDGIQAQIEKIEGRKNFLDDRTTFSTLTVELFEPEAGGELTPDEPTTDRPSLAHYWGTARDAFVNVVGALLVAVMFLLPLLIPLAVVVAVWLAYRRPRRRPAPPPAPQAEEEREPVGAGR